MKVETHYAPTVILLRMSGDTDAERALLEALAEQGIQPILCKQAGKWPPAFIELQVQLSLAKKATK